MLADFVEEVERTDPHLLQDFNENLDMGWQLQQDLERTCGYWSMVCSKVLIGNAGFRFIMPTGFVGEKERSDHHLLQDF